MAPRCTGFPYKYTSSALTRPSTATAFSLRLLLHYKATHVGSVQAISVNRQIDEKIKAFVAKYFIPQLAVGILHNGESYYANYVHELSSALVKAKEYSEWQTTHTRQIRGCEKATAVMCGYGAH